MQVGLCWFMLVYFQLRRLQFSYSMLVFFFNSDTCVPLYTQQWWKHLIVSNAPELKPGGDKWKQTNG